MTIAISILPENNGDICRDAHVALALQRLEEEEVQSMDKKEQMTMRDGKFATMMQQKEED